MIEHIRLSHPALMVLKCFLADVKTPLCGVDIVDAIGTPPGSLYPMLRRFEDAGWLSSKWETASPKKLGRPRRRLYRMTKDGRKLAADAFKDLGLLPGRSAQ